MKLRKNGVGFLLAAAMMIGSLTGCGDNSSQYTDKDSNYTDKDSSSPEIVTEMYWKGRDEGVSILFSLVPPEFMDYLEQNYDMTKKEIKEKVTDYFDDNKRVVVENVYFGSINYYDIDGTGRAERRWKEEMQYIGIENVIGYYGVNSTVNTVNDESFSYGNIVIETDTAFYSYDAMGYMDQAISGAKGTLSWGSLGKNEGGN
jgi:hypothetical protein